jgi:NADH-quinone oxidoreductase subunit I
MNSLIKKLFLVEIVKGMSLTLGVFLKGLLDPMKDQQEKTIVTRRYPKVKRPAEPGFRGLHALAKDDDGRMKCVGCGMCAAICPSQCIHIHTEETPDHKKQVVGYEIEVLRCVFCALCVEACPYGAVVLTEHYEYSNYAREDFDYTLPRLLENWDNYMAGEKGKNYFRRFWLPKTELFEGGKADGA